MAKKGIEEMISEIEIFIDNCKYKPLSSSMIIVPKDDLEQMLNELKLKLPNEIERCKKIMRNKEAILADARTRADSIITSMPRQSFWIPCMSSSMKNTRSFTRALIKHWEALNSCFF